MKRIKTFFGDRILLAILLPVIGVGVFISALSLQILVPPLVSILTGRTDAALIHATALGVAVCDERFGDLLDLRLENDPEMIAASRSEAVKQIQAISDSYPGIHMVVLGSDGEVVGASENTSTENLVFSDLKKTTSGILTRSFRGEPFKVHYRYFPFWRWHILSLISGKAYKAPILMAKRIIVFGTFGVLMIVILTVLVLFLWRVNLPLKRIITATEDVAKGQLKPLNVRRADEIGLVALAFNSMVASLGEDRRKIRTMMAELRDSEEQYRVLTEYSLANIAMIQKGRFTYANPRILETLGYTVSDFVGAEIEAPVFAQDRDGFLEKIKALERGEAKMDHFECRFETVSEEILWFEILAALILYKEKQAVLIHAVDITTRKEAESERQKLESKLAQAQKMEAVGALASGVAHDLNNILGGLVSYPELLLMDLPTDSPLRKPLSVIQKSGQRAADIVQDLLTLARRGVAVSEVVNLNDIVEGYLRSPEHGKLKNFYPNVEIKAHFAADLLNITGSPVHLSKTIMNLVSNAVEAMPDGGTVEINTFNQYVDTVLQGYETLQEGDYAVLSVSDQGIGISAEDYKKIFEPFYTKKVMGRSGTGLGMAVVWGTTKDHNGFIDISSSSGKGTRFDLYFPITRREKPAKDDDLALERLKGSESLLVVDDVEEQREIAFQILSRLGYRVAVVSSGEKALEYIREHPADLLVLDMIMDPGIDGLETYRRILDLYPQQKAIIASGFSETERVKEAQKLGAGAYVKKPYVIETLGMAVRAALNRKFAG